MTRRNHRTTERICPECGATGSEFASGDANCPCKVCQSSNQRHPGSIDPTWRPAAAHGVRRVFRTPGNHDRTRDE